MKYSAEQINHIVYNNRTYENVTKNFLPKLSNFDILKLLEIEKQINFTSKIITGNKNILIDKNKLNLDKDDIKLFPSDLEKIKVSSRKFNDNESKLLMDKKIPKNIIEEYDISPLSQFKDNYDIQKKLGSTNHPIFEKLLGENISDGLIIPLYKDGKLINSAIRKTSDLTKLKYGITVPSLNLWGDNNFEDKEICITEGLFDMMAIRREKLLCVSSSSGSLSDIQYLNIINNKPKRINIFVDNDSSGLISSLKAKKIFQLNGIETKTFISKKAKDMAEHFFELELGWDEIKEINITLDMIKKSKDNVFDFLKYLEKRKF